MIGRLDLVPEFDPSDFQTWFLNSTGWNEIPASGPRNAAEARALSVKGRKRR